jgi:hypothetical protein
MCVGMRGTAGHREQESAAGGTAIVFRIESDAWVDEVALAAERRWRDRQETPASLSLEGTYAC